MKYIKTNALAYETGHVAGRYITHQVAININYIALVREGDLSETSQITMTNGDLVLVNEKVDAILAKINDITNDKAK